MKKLPTFLLSFLIFCIFQYILNIFYYSPDSFKNKNCCHVWHNPAQEPLTDEDLDGIYGKPSTQMLIERGGSGK